ncbi:MAG: NADH-quinone oxidoreductase subunit M [Acidimicrobiia bacterium]
MEDFLNDWGLSLAIFLPLVGAAIMAVIPRAEEQLQKAVALITSLVVGAVGVALLVNFDMDRSKELQFVVDKSWIDVINSRYILGLDGISMPLMLLTMFIVVTCMLYSLHWLPEPRNAKAFLIMVLILETGMIGTFLAQDLILFFVFFEVVLVPMYFLIGVWGGEDRQYAAIKFFLFTLFGSALMLVSFLALYFLADASGTAAGVVHTFDMRALPMAASGIALSTQVIIFGGMFFGFAIKVPMFPMHTWLPDAHTQAPTVGSVILAAILLKLGVYGFIRIAIPILPEAAIEWAPFMGALSVIGIIYGAFCCLAQVEMKRLIAFSSVAHMGFTMLGVSTLTDFGINAAIFGMVAHGLITGLLFFITGSMKERYHTMEIKRLGGLLVPAPRMGWMLGIAVMASLGLPGLAGFWGEVPAILAAYSPAEGLSEPLFRAYMVIAAIGTVFAAAYLLWLYQRTAFGTPKEEFAQDPHITDMSVPEWAAWGPMILLIVVLGVYPNLLFKLTDPAVGAVSSIVAAAAGS